MAVQGGNGVASETALLAAIQRYRKDRDPDLPDRLRPVAGPGVRPARQQAFPSLVLDAYGRRCAVTGDKIRPVLQAAHIRAVAAGGQNQVDNGLLLRSDAHTLFDRGYLGVDQQSSGNPDPADPVSTGRLIARNHSPEGATLGSWTLA